jgi:hypothetical protein
MRSLINIISSVVALCAVGVAIAEAPAPKLAPVRVDAPPPPPVNDGMVAYQFRTRLLAAPQCQRFAAEADTVFLDDRTDIATKTSLLKNIEGQATANNCVTKQ